jgi:hypothetical protein
MKRSIPDLHKLTEEHDRRWAKGCIFTVIAERWSDRYSHTYPVGSYLTLSSALHNANKEVSWRGGKYGCRIYATRHPNQYKSERVVEIYEVRSPYYGRVKRSPNVA